METSKQIIEQAKQRFKELEHKGYDWSSFYNGFLEAKALNMRIVIRPFKTSLDLAIFMHNEYEKHAQKTGWNTQETCKVEFKDLPEANKKTMLLVAESVLNAL